MAYGISNGSNSGMNYGINNGGNYVDSGWNNYSSTRMVNTAPPNYQNQPTTVQQTRSIQPPIQVIPGKFINKENDILAMDIPTDGSIAFFIQNDLNKIYARTWGGDGNMRQNVYVKVEEGTQQTQGDSILNEILTRLGAIEEKLNNRPNYKKPHKNNRTNTQNRSEGNE